MLAATDERTEHMAEAIKGVQVMKVRLPAREPTARLCLYLPLSLSLSLSLSPSARPAHFPFRSGSQLYGWEDPFLTYAQKMRKVEMRNLRTIQSVQSVMRTGTAMDFARLAGQGGLTPGLTLGLILQPPTYPVPAPRQHPSSLPTSFQCCSSRRRSWAL